MIITEIFGKTLINTVSPDVSTHTLFHMQQGDWGHNHLISKLQNMKDFSNILQKSGKKKENWLQMELFYGEFQNYECLIEEQGIHQ